MGVTFKPAAITAASIALVVAAILIVPQGLAHLPGLERPAPAALNGTFIQFRQEHTGWKPEQWESLFEEFRELHLSRLVVQWSVLDKVAYYSNDGAALRAGSPLENVLQFADRDDMEILVGLDHDSAFGSRIGGTLREVDQFLQDRFSASLSVAADLLPFVSPHRSFKGWYVSEEIDDLNWRGTDARRVIAGRLGTLTDSLHRLSPNARIAVSGFASGSQSAGNLNILWSALLDASPHVDAVMFQDGIGVGYLDLQRLPSYLDALHEATAPRGRTLEVITEVFQQSEGYPIDNKPFKAIPASLARIDEQLRIAARFAQATVAFSVPEYLSARAGTGAATLYESYLNRFPYSARDARRASGWTAGHLM